MIALTTKIKPMMSILLETKRAGISAGPFVKLMMFALTEATSTSRCGRA